MPPNVMSIKRTIWYHKPSSILSAIVLLSLGLSCTSQEGSKQMGTLIPKAPSAYSIDELDQLYSPLRQDSLVLSEGL